MSSFMMVRYPQFLLLIESFSCFCSIVSYRAHRPTPICSHTDDKTLWCKNNMGRNSLIPSMLMTSFSFSCIYLQRRQRWGVSNWWKIHGRAQNVNDAIQIRVILWGTWIMNVVCQNNFFVTFVIELFQWRVVIRRIWESFTKLSYDYLEVQ